MSLLIVAILLGNSGDERSSRLGPGDISSVVSAAAAVAAACSNSVFVLSDSVISTSMAVMDQKNKQE